MLAQRPRKLQQTERSDGGPGAAEEQQRGPVEALILGDVMHGSSRFDLRRSHGGAKGVEPILRDSDVAAGGVCGFGHWEPSSDTGGGV